MTLYLYQNDTQTGPFTEEQLHQMLQSGQVTTETLAWRDGMGGWEPLGRVIHVAGQTLPPPPPKKLAVLAWSSLIIAIVSVVGWFILLAVAGMAQKDGDATPGFNIVVGLFLMGGLFLNLIAGILGVVAAILNKGRALGIVGACVNAAIIVGLIGLMLLGLAMKHAQS